MPRSRVNGGRRAHRRLTHKRQQIQQAKQREIDIKSYRAEVEFIANEIAEHHQTVHADCQWPKEEVAKAGKEDAA